MGAWEPLLDFDEVEHEMMLEDDTPSYEALVYWCGRYPQYSDQIAEKLVSRAITNIELGERQQLIIYDHDEIVMSQNFDRIDQHHYAHEVLRRRALEIPPRPVVALEPFDRQVLAAVYEFRGDGRSENIAARLSRTMRIGILPSAVSASLERLEKLGLIFELSYGPGAYRDRSDPLYWQVLPQIQRERDHQTCFRISIGGKRALAKTRSR
jgi:hypothetical protein